MDFYISGQNVLAPGRISTNALVGNRNHPIIPCAPSDLQPIYGNGVFGNVYLLALDNTLSFVEPSLVWSA